MVGETGEGGAVLLRLELFGVGAGGGVVDVQRVVGAREEQQFARRVEVERGVVQVGRFKQLSTCQTVGETCIGYTLTLVGRYVAMTSLTLAVVGAPFSAPMAPSVVTVSDQVQSRL